MTYSSSRFPNFAHGELITIGAYVSALSSRYVPFLPSVLLAAAVSSACGVLMYFLVVGPLLRRVTKTLFLMIATFSTGLIIRNMIALLAEMYGYLVLKPLVSTEIAFTMAGSNISTLFLWALSTSWAIVLGLHLFLTRTRTGKEMRAASNNPQLAMVCGINTEATTALSWGIGGMLAGLAGSFWGAFASVDPYLGSSSLLTFFAASVIGGLTSFFGTIVGGYVIGFGQNFVMNRLNIQFGIDVALKPLISFIIILVVLLVRPRGLAGLSLENLKRRFAK